MPGTIYRFDLDKTYLKTDFETIKGLIKTAFEKPEEKESFPGADTLIREIQKESGNQIYFISGSPEQMRRVLEKKLNMDGIKWSQLILKPNLKNLLLGRFHALKEQVSYKLPVLLESRAKLKSPAQEVLFGDDAESDAFVYSLYADAVAGRIKIDTIEEIFHLAGAHKEAYEIAQESLKNLRKSDDIRRILIHLDKKSPPKQFEKYGERVVPFYNYFQAALILYKDNLIGIGSVLIVLNDMITRKGYKFRLIANSFQDLVRRGIISVEDSVGIIEEISRQSEMVNLLKDKRFYSDMEELVESVKSSEKDESETSDSAHMLDYVELYAEEHKKQKKRKKGILESLFE
jgi:hypothetical protein